MSAAKHTPGPWEVDTVRNEGEYGNGGPDSHVGFESFAIIDEKGRVLFDTLNRDGALTEIDEEADAEDGYHRAWDRLAQADAQHVVRCVNAHDDLLEALQAFMALDATFTTICTEGLAELAANPGRRGDMPRAVQKARAAIAKATGSAS